MTEHQKRLWQGMIDLIQSYINGENKDFCGVVDKLEGALDASEIKDTSLIKEWYDFWTPLEIYRSVNGNDVKRGEVMPKLIKMKEFLLSKAEK